MPQLLRLFPKEPPLCCRCQDGAGSHHHTLHSWVLPHCKTIENMAISELWAAPQHCQRRYIWSRFVDFPWECFQIKRRWGNLWKMEYPVLGSVFCRHTNVSFNSKADSVSSCKVHPGFTCWWPSTQRISEGKAKFWKQKSSIGRKVRPPQKLKYRFGLQQP